MANWSKITDMFVYCVTPVISPNRLYLYPKREKEIEKEREREREIQFCGEIKR